MRVRRVGLQRHSTSGRYWFAHGGTEPGACGRQLAKRRRCTGRRRVVCKGDVKIEAPRRQRVTMSCVVFGWQSAMFSQGRLLAVGDQAGVGIRRSQARSGRQKAAKESGPDGH